MDQFLGFLGQGWIRRGPASCPSFINMPAFSPTKSSQRSARTPCAFFGKDGIRAGGSELLQIFFFEGINQDPKHFGIDFVLFCFPVFQAFDLGQSGTENVPDQEQGQATDQQNC